MPKSDQGTNTERYTVVPRTAIFLRRDDAWLLIRGASAKRLWPDRYNCLGGHVERGEDILEAAKRELREETGLEADLWLCGTVLVDVDDTGICLFVFMGDSARGKIKQSDEGVVEWIPYGRIVDLPVVEDLPVLLNRVQTMQRGDAPFSARSFYDEHEKLTVIFSE